MRTCLSLWILSGLLLVCVSSEGQQFNNTLIFVSDTQAPMTVEKIWLKPNRNEEATGLVFEDILREKPNTVFLLGDVVSLGYREKKWSKVDKFLQGCHTNHIETRAVLGNHDVMTFGKSGEKRFQQRFPDHVRTGYTVVRDSVAVVMLNSNFKKLSKDVKAQQQQWLKETLFSLDMDPAILCIIVTCHHAPFSNSKIVGSSEPVQKNFVPGYLSTAKARIFITGHSHNFEHFVRDGKDFLVIGGGGGLHQPLDQSEKRLNDVSWGYKPDYHYLEIRRKGKDISVTSRALNKEFTSFQNAHHVEIPLWP